MLQAPGAVRLAIDLLHSPTQVRSVRSAPLPSDIHLLLRIVAGDEDATKGTAKSLGRTSEAVREAASFFVEQILLYPGADSYRVLGAMPEASYGELRRNMVLLVRWLHPDGDGEQQRTVFATRVTRAWNDLKNEERRVAYDQSRRLSKTKAPPIDKDIVASDQSSRPATNSNHRRPHRHGAPSRFSGHGAGSPRRHGGPRRKQPILSLPLSIYAETGKQFLHRILLQLLGRRPL